MAVLVPPKQAAKAWVSVAGVVVTTAVYLLNQAVQFAPPQYTPYITAAVGVLTSVAVFFTPAVDAQGERVFPPTPPSPTPAQVEESRADTPARGWKPPWPRP